MCSIPLVRLNSLVFCIYVFCQISRKRWKARIPKQSCTKEFKRYVFCIHPLNLTFVNFVIYQEFRVPGPSLYHLIGSGSYRSRQEAGGPGPSLHSIICSGSYRSRQEAGGPAPFASFEDLSDCIGDSSPEEIYPLPGHLYFLLKRKWVFATSTNYLVRIFLPTNVVEHRYFKPWILLDYI